MINYQKPFVGDVVPNMSLKRIEREEKNRQYENFTKLKFVGIFITSQNNKFTNEYGKK
jgi:hypothetical protein